MSVQKFNGVGWHTVTNCWLSLKEEENERCHSSASFFFFFPTFCCGNAFRYLFSSEFEFKWVLLCFNSIPPPPPFPYLIQNCFFHLTRVTFAFVTFPFSSLLFSLLSTRDRAILNDQGQTNFSSPRFIYLTQDEVSNDTITPFGALALSSRFIFSDNDDAKIKKEGRK